MDSQRGDHGSTSWAHDQIECESFGSMNVRVDQMLRDGVVDPGRIVAAPTRKAAASQR
jgi:hypothetical protein